MADMNPLIQRRPAERMSAAIAATPPDRQSILLAIAESAILGAQIAEQCAANLDVQKDAS